MLSITSSHGNVQSRKEEVDGKVLSSEGSPFVRKETFPRNPQLTSLTSYWPEFSDVALQGSCKRVWKSGHMHFQHLHEKMGRINGLGKQPTKSPKGIRDGNR